MKRGFLNTKKMQKAPLHAKDPTPGMHVESSTGSIAKYTVVPLSYEKIEDAGVVPTDYKPVQVPIMALDAAWAEHDKNTLSVITIPSQMVGEVPDPDGYSEWIVRGPTKWKVLNAPGYPRPVPKPVGGASFEVKSTPNMGIGVFATRDIELGELIFAERPLLVTPRNINTFGPGVPAGYTMEQFQKIVMMEWEKRLEVSVDRMSPENREAFMALMNSHKADGSGPLLGITRTNGYGLDEVWDGDGPTVENDAFRYTATGKTASRINHSCMPNILQTFNLASFSLQFKASKDIKYGEQLFYSYCEVHQGVAARRLKLAPYGIICECSACVNATPETDKFREDMLKRIEKLTSECRAWIRGAAPARKDLDEIIHFQEAVVKEGLHSERSYGVLLSGLMTAHMKLGMYDRAQDCYDLLVKHQKLYN